MEKDAMSLEDWICDVEDKAWWATANVAGCRFLLGNLLAELDRLQLVNAAEFIARLRTDLSGMGSKQEETGVQGLLYALANHFEHSPGSQDGSNSGGTTFH